MLINVDDPVRNLVLNACFYSVLLLTLVAIIPWGALGAVRMSRFLRWLPLPLLGLAIAYETAMPLRFEPDHGLARKRLAEMEDGQG
jgi:hypothetical protein